VHWLPLPTALVAAHVVADVVWIGAILSSSLLLAGAPFMADPSDTGLLARRIYARLATPAFLMSFATGVGRIALFPAVYAHLPWMHVKLTFVLGLVAFHHIIGARAKRLADGQVGAAKGATVIGAMAFVCAAAAAVLAVAKSLP